MTDILTRFGVTYAEVPLPQTLTDGEGDSLENDIPLDTDVNTLVLEVTEEQYTNLLSAALNGANRYFPESYIAVIYPLIKAAKMSNALCEAVAACIANPESDTYSALQDWLLNELLNNEEISDIINSSGGDQSTPVAGNDIALYADCDLDNLFGFTLQVTQLMNRVVVDFYEKLEGKSNFLEALPVITQEASAFSYFIEYVEFILNSAREAYLDNYDVSYENEIACGLFCIAQVNEDCALTWEEVTYYFADRIGAYDFLGSLSTLLTFIVSGSWIGTEFCDLSLMTFAMLMRIGASWTGIDLSMLQKIVMSYYNDPNSDWMTLCDCGYLYLYEYEQTYQNGFNPTQGQWATTHALFSTSSSPYGVTIEQTYGTPFDGLKKIAIYTLWSSTGSPQVELTLTHAGGTDNLSMSVANNSWREFTLPATRDGVSYIKFHTTTATGVSVAYDKIRMEGVGDNPPPDPVNPP
jgi:hypothetical protein